MTVDEFWKSFLTKTGRSSDTRYLESFYFDMNERSANSLLELVLSGKKRATASSLLAYGKESSVAPKVGDLSIVTDWEGSPRCVIETTAVQVYRFGDITFDICRREGEDSCLETWRDNHTCFFTEEGKKLGYEFSEDMPVLFEDFKLVYPV
ncbi:MAG: ASCH domain-containing protein [Oscillospiraceae bacterium]|nr:ASCH domain-containing protein [Oscillospiraceae bacterium]